MGSAIHLMLDIETFGKGNSAGLVQLGVCAFTLAPETQPMPSAEWTIALQSSLLLGGEVDADTVGWWGRQSDVARRAVSGPAVPIGVALAGLRTPWAYSACRDTRTLFDMAEQLAGWRRDVAPPIAHTAAADAMAQARDVRAAWAAFASPRLPQVAA